MANYRRRNTTEYRTYGSVAYAPAYDGSAVRAPRREEELRRAPAPYPKRQQQIRKRERARAEVRQAGAVAPFAVIGFLAVAIFAVMLITSYAQLTVANDEMQSLRKELSTLKSDNATLTAQYEKVFDLAAIPAHQRPGGVHRLVRAGHRRGLPGGERCGNRGPLSGGGSCLQQHYRIFSLTCT